MDLPAASHQRRRRFLIRLTSVLLAVVLLVWWLSRSSTSDVDERYCGSWRVSPNQVVTLRPDRTFVVQIVFNSGTRDTVGEGKWRIHDGELQWVSTSDGFILSEYTNWVLHRGGYHINSVTEEALVLDVHGYVETWEKVE